MMSKLPYAMEQNLTYEINANLNNVPYSMALYQCSLWWLTQEHRIDPYVQNILRRLCVTVKDLVQVQATDDDLATVTSLLGDRLRLLQLLNSRTFTSEFIESLGDQWVTTHMLIKSRHIA
jgi:hypothetical protein